MVHTCYISNNSSIPSQYCSFNIVNWRNQWCEYQPRFISSNQARLHFGACHVCKVSGSWASGVWSDFTGLHAFSWILKISSLSTGFCLRFDKVRKCASRRISWSDDMKSFEMIPWSDSLDAWYQSTARSIQQKPIHTELVLFFVFLLRSAALARHQDFAKQLNGPFTSCSRRWFLQYQHQVPLSLSILFEFSGLTPLIPQEVCGWAMQVSFLPGRRATKAPSIPTSWWPTSWSLCRWAQKHTVSVLCCVETGGSNKERLGDSWTRHMYSMFWQLFGAVPLTSYDTHRNLHIACAKCLADFFLAARKYIYHHIVYHSPFEIITKS